MMDSVKLKEEIDREIENLERLAKEMDEIIKRTGNEPDFIKARAAGSILHDFYCGVEKIFERIAVMVDNKLPEGEDWHKELLLQMGKPVENLRNRVIATDLMEALKEYLRFRHLFRHIYGFELRWQRFKDIAFSLHEVLSDLKKSLEIFFGALNKRTRESQEAILILN